MFWGTPDGGYFYSHFNTIVLLLGDPSIDVVKVQVPSLACLLIVNRICCVVWEDGGTADLDLEGGLDGDGIWKRVERETRIAWLLHPSETSIIWTT